jgi:hypothetical protein
MGGGAGRCIARAIAHRAAIGETVVDVLDAYRNGWTRLVADYLVGIPDYHFALESRSDL